jgi:endonuclease III
MARRGHLLMLTCAVVMKTTVENRNGKALVPKPVNVSASYIRQINRRLKVYGTSRHHNRKDPLEEMIFIILSAQTEWYSFRRTFSNLRRRFPSRKSLITANETEIERIIQPGGLARKKAVQLKRALEKIEADTGRLSLRFLRALPDKSVRDYLTSLAGVGNKTASCIMMYSLERNVFPVDTHVWRIARRLGLAPAVAKPTESQELALEAKVPPSIRYSLHVNLVSHGQQTCTTYWPKCSECVLNDICPSRDRPDEVWGGWRRPSGVWAKAVMKNGSQKRRDPKI